jgi:hypothetical protein
VIRGVAAVNSRGRVYVPHGSHGAVMEDNVSVSPWAQSLWWDHNNAGDRTHDLTVRELLVLGTFMPRSSRRRSSWAAATATSCAAAWWRG